MHSLNTRRAMGRAIKFNWSSLTVVDFRQASNVLPILREPIDWVELYTSVVVSQVKNTRVWSAYGRLGGARPGPRQLDPPSTLGTPVHQRGGISDHLGNTFSATTEAQYFRKHYIGHR